MHSIVTEDNKFEIWDGGHCFVRVKVIDNKVHLLRFPNPMPVVHMLELANWLKGVL